MTALPLPQHSVRPLGPAWAWAAWFGLLVLSAGFVSTDFWLRSLLWAPLVEELCFRLGVQRFLQRRVPAVWAITGTAIGFTALHFFLVPDVWSLLTVLPAWAIGWVYQRGHGLAVCVLVHAMANGFWVLLRPFLFPF